MKIMKSVRSACHLQLYFNQVYTFGHAVDGAQFFGSLMEDDGKDFPENVDIDPAKHVLTLPYSSGTTGLPKGVMLSHRNIISNLLQIGYSHIFKITKYEVCCADLLLQQ